MNQLEATIQQASRVGTAPALIVLLVVVLAINLAVFVGRRVPNVRLAYPLALVVGLAVMALAPLISSLLLLAA